MKSRFGLIYKIIMTASIVSMTMPTVIFAANTSVVGGAAGLGRNSDGTINVALPDDGENNDSSISNNTTNINLNVEKKDTRDLSGTIMDGVFIDKVDVSNLNYQQAVQKVNDYVAGFGKGEITLESIDGNTKVITADELGIKWTDDDVVAEALSLGKTGNIVQKYKEKKDIQNEKKAYELKLSYNTQAIKDIVEEQGQLYNVKAEKGNLVREGGSFKITPGKTGYVIDVDESVKEIEERLTDYRGQAETIALKVIEDNPSGSTEDLEKVKDLLGSFTTSFSSSGADRSGNVRNGTSLVNGTLLLPGEQFSMYNTVSPFTEENGYFMAGSYLNGMVVESLGGGICQVSSTLYNAVIRAELEVNERYNHSMIVTYVKMSSDAAISGTSKDFKFTNTTDYPIYIEGYTTDDKKIVFNIYGVETRPSNRTLEFESVELSKTEPVEEKIVADPSQPLGFISVQSAHTGYSGEFWKIVKVDGVETDRIRLNKSNYQATPRTATVGTGTDNAAALATLQQAMATGSIDFVKSTISQLNAAAAAAAMGGQ